MKPVKSYLCEGGIEVFNTTDYPLKLSISYDKSGKASNVYIEDDDSKKLTSKQMFEQIMLLLTKEENQS